MVEELDFGGWGGNSSSFFLLPNLSANDISMQVETSPFVPPNVCMFSVSGAKVTFFFFLSSLFYVHFYTLSTKPTKTKSDLVKFAFLAEAKKLTTLC